MMDYSEKIIDGKTIAAEVNRETAGEVAEITKNFGARPGLAVILVGVNPASKVYVASKVKRCLELGIHSEKIVLVQKLHHLIHAFAAGVEQQVDDYMSVVHVGLTVLIKNALPRPPAGRLLSLSTSGDSCGISAVPPAPRKTCLLW